jgi:protein-S-isoprenylcysteine O-methyltransferase Ste14
MIIGVSPAATTALPLECRIKRSQFGLQSVQIWLMEDLLAMLRVFTKMKRSAQLFTILPLIAIAWLVFAFAPGRWTPQCVLGLALTLGAGAVWTVAHVQLGNSFTIRPQANALVTRGIYSRMRNPIYVFSAITLAGLVLYVDEPGLFWLFLILIPVQIMRARRESRLLEKRFGEEYRQYKAKTWI